MQEEAHSRLWTCWLLPLAPALSSLLAVAGAIGMVLLGTNFHTRQALWPAFALELISVLANVAFATRLHAGHSHSDANTITATWHLIGDSLASILAALAYLTILLNLGRTSLDFWAGVGGAAIILIVHIGPTGSSLAEFSRHRKPGHLCNSNSQPAPGH